jgi:spore germination cell wall hydrolase CwlJ-like protein
LLASLSLAISLIISAASTNFDNHEPLPLQDRNLKCLAVTAYAEARGQGLLGMSLVIQSVVNRAEHPSFPGSYCEVVESPYQYTGVHRWTTPRKPWEGDLDAYVLALVATHRVLTNQADFGDCGITAPAITHFFNPRLAQPRWARHPSATTLCEVGGHRFLALI